MSPPAEDAADLAAMFDGDGFGLTVTITPKAAPGSPFSVQAIYDAEERDVSVGLEVDVSTYAPSLLFIAADVAQVVQGDGVSIPDVGAFTFRETPRPDGTGLARARLRGA